MRNTLVTEEEKQRIRDFRRDNPKLFLREVARIFQRSPSAIHQACRDHTKPKQSTGPKTGFHRMKDRVPVPFKAPKTGSDSGFIRALPYGALVARR